jgi:hypothetical protein
MNEQASSYLPTGLQPDGAVVYDGAALRVIRADPELMLALKVSAFRLGDREDIDWLARHLELNDPDEIIELTEHVMGTPLREIEREEVHTMFGRDAPTRERPQRDPDPSK